MRSDSSPRARWPKSWLIALSLVAFAGSTAFSPALLAQTPLKSVYLSSDIRTLIYGDSGQTSLINGTDKHIYIWNDSGDYQASPDFISGPETDPIDVAGYNRDPRLFVINTARIIDGTLVRPNSIVEVNTILTNPTVVFDGNANALPAGVNIDAVTVDPVTGDFVMSFDRSVGGSPLFRKSDLVRWTGSTYELYFQGNMLPASADINGAHILQSGNILMTFESGIAVPGAGGTFYARDDDIVEYDPGTGLFTMTAVDLNAHPNWRRTAADALAATEGGDALFADRFEG